MKKIAFSGKYLFQVLFIFILTILYGNAGNFCYSQCSPASTTSGSNTVLTFSAVGTCTWTVPAGIYSITIHCWGGGGGGGGTTKSNDSGYAGGGGGGGGAYSVVSLSVIPGQTYGIVVGGGGNGGSSSGGNGSSGGTSSVTNFNVTPNAIVCSAVGGAGGVGRTSSGSGAGGAGGASGVGFLYKGGKGSNAPSSDGGGGGGGAGSGSIGSDGVNRNGGAGGTGTYPGGAGAQGADWQAGVNATTLAAGGGGALSSWANESFKGGNGGKGEVKIVYNSCTPPPAPLQVVSNILVGPTKDGNLASLGTPLLPDANMSGGDGTHHAYLGRLFNPLTGNSLFNLATSCWIDTYNGGALGGWKADLGSVKTINGIYLQGRPYTELCTPSTPQFTTSVTVYVSSDNSTWTNVGTFAGNTDTRTVKTIVFPTPVQGRYVRIDGGGVFRADVFSIPCGSGSHSVSVSAELPIGATNIRWYNAPTGGTLLGTGLYLTRTISQNTTFYAASYNGNGGCESSKRTAVTAYVGSNPANPSVSANPPMLACGTPAELSVSSSDFMPEPRVGLVAHYPFNNSLNDISGRSLNLSGTGNFSQGGLLLNGSIHESAITDVLDNDYHTISFYIKFTQTPTTWFKIFGYEPGGDGAERSPGIWTMETSPGLHWRYNLGNTGLDQSVSSLNKWYHVVGIKNGGTFKLYIDGTLVQTVTVANPKGSGSATLRFGNGPGVVLRDFKIFNRVISEAEITDLGLWEWYSGACGGSGATLIGKGPQITVNPSVTTTYYLRTKNTCGQATCYSYIYNAPLNPPTSVTATHVSHPNYCVGQTINLNSVGGSTASDAVDIWYKDACSESFVDLMNAFNYTSPTCNQHSHTSVTVDANNGIVKLKALGGDPFIWLGGLNLPSTHKYINVRYRITNVPAGYNANPTSAYPDNYGHMLIFFSKGDACTNSPYPWGATGYSNLSERLITDGSWNVVSVDMGNYWTTGGNITGIRIDWTNFFTIHTQNTGLEMEIDFISVSEGPIVGSGTNLTLSPTNPYYTDGTSTYYTKKVNSCGFTSCASTTVNFPTRSGVLANNNESATCVIGANETIHFFNRTSGNYIASVTANGSSLGSTIATAYVETNPLLVEACTNPNFETAVMNRHWVITPTTNGQARVRLPYYQSELNSLANLSITSSSNVDLVSQSDLNTVQLSKYSGGVFPATTNVDANPNNNCTVGGTTGHLSVDRGTTFPVALVNSYFSDFSVPGFSEFWLHGNATITPLFNNLLSFESDCEQNLFRLSWSQENESNVAKYSIETSRDGVEWIERRIIIKNGIDGYEYQEVLNLSGDKYCRLNQYMYDGSMSIVGLQLIDCDGGMDGMTIVPNPNAGNFKIVINSTEEIEDAQIVIEDVSGKVVLTKVLSIVSGLTELNVNQENFEAGTYLVSIRNKDRRILPTRMIVVN